MARVLIVNPPNSNTVLDGATCTVTRPEDHTDWSNFPSLGVLTLASALADIPDVTPVYIDGTVVPWPILLDYIDIHADDILAVCTSALTATYEAALAILAHAKAVRPRIWTVMGNDHFTALTEQCLTNHHDCIDFGFRGNEVVSPFRALIADLNVGRLREPAAYPGIAVWRDGQVISVPQRPETVFTALRHDLVDAAFDHSTPYKANFQTRVAPQLRKMLGVELHAGMPVEIGRGCIKFRRNDACSFCSIQFGGMWKNSVHDPHAAWQLVEHMSRNAYDYLYLTADELPLTFGGLLRGMLDEAPRWWTRIPENERPVMVGYARADGLSNPRHAETLRRLGVRQLMVGLDAGAPISLMAMNKPLSPIKDNDPAHRAELMFDHNVRAMQTARDHGLLLKVGFVIGHLGMTPELLADNIASMQRLIDAGKGVIASLDVEVLSPEPGSLDYRYLTDPELAEQAADRLGLSVAAESDRREIASHWKELDVIDREAAMAEYVAAVMPGLTLDDLATARGGLREYGKAAGIVIGE
ncbi:B12-binding domain-containing radical SAM protein [Streptomyces alkaliphilus]|uniref:B12-binding domain-containing radical SAM protein n=1 Tax=Streptomyces alkaliphilus TaxID=1472722 RepID=UPI00117D6738|nr:radical SAM protein [Streptomyces alkaliphilus]MQS05642.1 radical SAM protein [Streptomyces alkaliphilus]